MRERVSALIVQDGLRLHRTSLTPTSASAIKLTVVIPAALLTTAGTFDVVVNNPALGGGDSNALHFVVK